MVLHRSMFNAICLFKIKMIDLYRLHHQVYNDTSIFKACSL